MSDFMNDYREAWREHQELHARPRALSACNVCDGAIETPNELGYCNDHLAELGDQFELDSAKWLQAIEDILGKAQ